MSGSIPRAAGKTVKTASMAGALSSRVLCRRDAIEDSRDGNLTAEPAIDRSSYRTHHNVPLIPID
jgi:hypothetical protein